MSDQYKVTLNVSLFNFEGAICLPTLWKGENLHPMIQKVQEGSMNKNQKILSCVGVILKLKDGTIATLNIYAARIIVRAKKSKELIGCISDTLNSINVNHAINKKERELVITLYTLGNYNKVSDVEHELKTTLLEEFDVQLKEIQYDMPHVHVTGTRSKEHLNEIGEVIPEMFNDTKIAPNLKLNYCSNIMSNFSYVLANRIATYDLAILITEVPGFEDAFCIYDNVRNPNCVVIYLPLNANNLPSDIDSSLFWRDNIEASYTVKKTGQVTQSCPSIDVGIYAYEMFQRAIKILGDRIVRFSPRYSLEKNRKQRLVK